MSEKKIAILDLKKNLFQKLSSVNLEKGPGGFKLIIYGSKAQLSTLTTKL